MITNCQFRLKVIKRSTGESYLPQIKKEGIFTRWKSLQPERMYPEIVRVHIEGYALFSFSKEEALQIIEVYKREQDEKKIKSIEYINL